MKRKYRPGPKVHSLNELMEQDFVYWGDKIEPKNGFRTGNSIWHNTSLTRGAFKWL